MAIRECIPRLTALGISHDDAAALRRISMTLRAWFTLECGNSDDRGSWAIERDETETGDGLPYMVYHAHHHPYRYMVECDGDDGSRVAATSKRFHSEASAKEYAATVAASRNPSVKPVWTRRERIADREAGARKRLAAIMARYPSLSYYVQGDPRGASLYILRPGDVPAGEDASCYYSRGIAVYQ